MSSVQHLREFIRERLTAVAQEIFTEVEKTIICYEEELDAQRRMMGINWKPEIKLHRIGSELQRQSFDLQQSSVSNEEESPGIQQVSSLANESRQDQKEVEGQWAVEVQMEPEPKRIKKEENKPEPALLKHEEIEYPLTYVRKDELDSSVLQHEQQPPEHLPTGQNQKNLCSSQEGEQLVQKEPQRKMMGINWKPQMKLHRIGSELQRQSSDLQQPSVSNEEETFVIQQVWSLASRSSQDQKEPEPQWTEEEQMEPQPKWVKGEDEPEPTLLKDKEIEYPLTNVKIEELDSSVLPYEQQPAEHLPTGQNQKNLCSSQEGEQLVQKMFAALTETSSLQEDDMNEEKRRTEQLSLHISPVVESKDQEGSSSSVSESQAGTSAKKTSFKCDICGRCYPRQWNLKNHYRTHTGEKPFSCETCRKSFSQISSLNSHKRIHTGEKPFSCQSCGKSFSQISSLNSHKRIHTGERPFSCQSCGKRFSHISHLKEHNRVHTGEKPFSCQSCGKRFSHISSLNTHKRIHTGEKPFSCQSCGKRFSQISHLKEHNRVHTGEKPFSCQLCGKTFSRFSSLNDHKKIHTGERPFSCQSCGKIFIRISQLKDHNRIHTDEKPFSCQSCGKNFTRLGSLNRHKMSHAFEKGFHNKQ